MAAKRGRPPSKTPRTALLTIRVTKEELAALNRGAKARGLTVAAMVRAILAG